MGKGCFCVFAFPVIDIEVQLERDEVPWRFTAIYGWPETHLKWKTCALISELRRVSSLPWLIGGDLNEIFCNYEKKGGIAKCQSILARFRETAEECGLLDLGYNGYDFTWDNRQQGDRAMEERLDRFCSTSDWMALFPSFRVLSLIHI